MYFDARDERVRQDGRGRPMAVLTAVECTADGRQHALSVMVVPSEAAAHWRGFMPSLEQRGLHGVRLVVTDGHAGLRAGGRTVFPAATWQRCQFHLGQNALRHAPTVAIRRSHSLGAQLRDVWDAPDQATAALAAPVHHYAAPAPYLAAWLAENVPEGWAVLDMPAAQHRRLRTTNPIERGVQPELKRRTQLVWVFPHMASLERLVTALLMRIAEEWAASAPETEYQEEENERA